MDEQERPFTPTQHRLDQAHRSGYVAISRDLVSAVVGATAFLLATWGAKAWIGDLISHIRRIFLHIVQPVPAFTAVVWGGQVALRALVLPMGILLLAGVATCIAQTHGLIGNLSRPHNFPSVRRHGFLELAKIAGKVVVVGIVYGVFFPSLASVFVPLREAGPDRVLMVLGRFTENLGGQLAIVALTIGLLDRLWQKYRYRAALRMSRDEFKREQKEIEGDPLFKAGRRRMHHQLLESHTYDDVRKAQVVLLEIGGLALAIQYVSAEGRAPTVLMKGNRQSAERIEQIARSAGVPTIVAPELVRKLSALEEGDEIPASMYESVAALFVRENILSNSLRAAPEKAVCR
jgi:flagellar biosynthesis protein FlhB